METTILGFRVLSIVIMGVILGIMEKKMETAILGFRLYVPTSSTWNLHGLLDGVCLWMFWTSLFWARGAQKAAILEGPTRLSILSRLPN